MRPQRKLLAIPLMILLLVSIACNLPRLSAPTPFSTPTPNTTLTAIFEVLNTVVAPTSMIPSTTPTLVFLPTNTLQPSAVPSATSIPPTATNTTIPPSATSIPTKTPVSYVGPDERPGPTLRAYYLQNEPSIDGVFDDWDLDRYPISSVVYGADNWEDSNDLSARVMFGWDEEFLYIAARVIDEEYVQNATEEDLFKGDSIEILIDTKVSRDFYLDSLSSDDYQLGVSPGNPGPGTGIEAYLWYPQNLEGSQILVKAGATPTDDGYRIEVKIPWSLFSITPDRGQNYGFVFSVSDNDRSDRNVQQSMISSIATRTLTDPTTWGNLYLMGQFR